MIGAVRILPRRNACPQARHNTITCPQAHSQHHHLSPGPFTTPPPVPRPRHNAAARRPPSGCCAICAGCCWDGAGPILIFRAQAGPLLWWLRRAMASWTCAGANHRGQGRPQLARRGWLHATARCGGGGTHRRVPAAHPHRQGSGVSCQLQRTHPAVLGCAERPRRRMSGTDH